MSFQTAFTFLVTSKDPSQQESLLIPKINSHLARHRQLKRQQGLKQVSSSWTVISHSNSDYHFRRGTMSNNNVEGAYLRKQIKDSQVFSVIGLDPFLKLPLDISARDQQLLQFRE